MYILSARCYLMEGFSLSSQATSFISVILATWMAMRSCPCVRYAWPYLGMGSLVPYKGISSYLVTLILSFAVRSVLSLFPLVVIVCIPDSYQFSLLCYTLSCTHVPPCCASTTDVVSSPTLFQGHRVSVVDKHWNHPCVVGVNYTAHTWIPSLKANPEREAIRPYLPFGRLNLGSVDKDCCDQAGMTTLSDE